MVTSKESALISSLSILLSSYAVMILTLMTSIILNRSLGPETKGNYAGMLLLPSLFTPLFMFGYTGGVLYYALRRIINIERFFVTGFFTLLVLGGGMSFVIYYLAKVGVFGQIISNHENNILYMLCLITPIVFLNGYMEKVLISLKLFRPSSIRNTLGALSLVLSISILWFIGELNLFTSLGSAVFAILIQFSINIYFVLKNLDINYGFERPNLIKPWNYGIRSFLNQLISKSNDKFDRIILGFVMRPLDFGLYTTGVALCSMVATIPSSYTKVFFTQIASRSEEDAVQLLYKAIRITFLISIVLSFILVVMAKLVIFLLYGSSFERSVTVVYFYVPGMIFQIVGRLPIKFFAARGKPLKNSIIYATALIISVPFYFWLIPLIGLNGAAVSSSIAYIAAFFMSLIQLRRDYSLNLNNFFLLEKGDLIQLGQVVHKIISRKK